MRCQVFNVGNAIGVWIVFGTHIVDGVFGSADCGLYGNRKIIVENRCSVRLANKT